LRYLHSILAQCALPYREPKQADGAQALKYRRRNGRSELLVTAGEALNPLTRRLEQQGVPYGAKPRLLFIHHRIELTFSRSGWGVEFAKVSQ
jgi:hypothetical protein